MSLEFCVILEKVPLESSLLIIYLTEQNINLLFRIPVSDDSSTSITDDLVPGAITAAPHTDSTVLTARHKPGEIVN